MPTSWGLRARKPRATRKYGSPNCSAPKKNSTTSCAGDGLGNKTTNGSSTTALIRKLNTVIHRDDSWRIIRKPSSTPA